MLSAMSERRKKQTKVSLCFITLRHGNSKQQVKLTQKFDGQPVVGKVPAYFVVIQIELTEVAIKDQK